MLRAAMLGALVGAAVATSGWAQQAAAPAVPEAAAPEARAPEAPAERSLADLRAELRTLAAELKSLRAELNVSGAAGFKAAGGDSAIDRMNAMERDLARLTGEAERLRNRTKSRARARVEHPFHVLKRLWGFVKVRYRGLAKNANRVFTALAMVNLYMAARRVPALVRP